MTGWTCSVCGEANAPQNTRCVNGPHAKTGATTVTIWPPFGRPFGHGEYTWKAPLGWAVWNVDDIRQPVVS